eukprot:4035287-Ditylum_brightwellii.AAC.1
MSVDAFKGITHKPDSKDDKSQRCEAVDLIPKCFSGHQVLYKSYTMARSDKKVQWCNAVQNHQNSQSLPVLDPKVA